MEESDRTGKINNALLLKTKMLEEEIGPLRKIKGEVDGTPDIKSIENGAANGTQEQ